MQIQDYIKAAKASGLSSSQIAANLVKAGWPQEQVTLAIDSASSSDVALPTNKPSNSQKQLLIVGGVLFFLVLIMPFLKYMVERNTMVEPKYGFSFSNLSGWRKIPPIEGADISLETIPSWNISFSVANLRIKAEPNVYMMGRIPMKEIRSTYMSRCQSLATALRYEYLSTETVDIADTFTLKCKLEGKIQNKNANMIVQEDYYIIKKKYNLLISASYRKDFPQGEALINQLMNGFKVLGD